MSQNSIKDLTKLIAYNSVSARGNLPLAKFVASLMAKAGFEVIYQKTRINGQNYANLIARKGPAAGSPLVLCAHMDTVPPGDLQKWTKTARNPWKAVISGGRVYGLGSADDKASLVAMLEAGRRFSGDALTRPLVVAGTFSEETGMAGAKLLIRQWKGTKPHVALVGEPTELAITYRHKGIGVVVITLTTSSKQPIGAVHTRTFKGIQAHSSRPWLGDNALEKAMAHLRTLDRRTPVVAMEAGSAANLIPDLAEVTLTQVTSKTRPSQKRHALFPAGAVLACFDAVQAVLKRRRTQKDRSFYPSVITSNFAISRTHGNAMELMFDFRLLPGQEIGPIHREIQKDLARSLKPFRSIKAHSFIERDNPPLTLQKNHALPQQMLRLAKAIGLKTLLNTKPSCTEAGVYDLWGVPAVVVGPGKSIGNIHSPNEHVEISSIEKAIVFYTEAIRHYCQAE